MSTVVVGYLLAGVIGLSLGLVGGGGSILAVPVLVYLMGITPKTAIAMSLVIVGMVSLFGAIPHWRLGNVCFQTALLFAPAAMLGTYLGARLAALPAIDDTIQMGLFAATMLLAAVLMICKSDRSSPDVAIASEVQGSVSTSQHRNLWLWIAIEGFGVGVLTGLVGVGGGFAIVPALVLLGNIPMQQAVGTSLPIVALKSVTGFLGYLGQVELDLQLMVSFTIAASGGTLLGVYLVPSLKAQHLQKGFGCFLVLLAGFILWQNWQTIS